jgi:hypothetical protein
MDNSEQITKMKLVYGDDDAQLVALLGESLAPRPPDFLLDLAVPLLTPESRLLDVGCRDARHLIPLSCGRDAPASASTQSSRTSTVRGPPSPLQISIIGSRSAAV